MMSTQAPLSRVTITLPSDLAQKLLYLRLSHGVSVSAIAEAAIRLFLESHQNGELEGELRARGAGLRRSPTL